MHHCQWPSVTVYSHKGLLILQMCTEYDYSNNYLNLHMTAHFCQWHFGAVRSIDGQQL